MKRKYNYYLLTLVITCAAFFWISITMAANHSLWNTKLLDNILTTKDTQIIPKDKDEITKWINAGVKNEDSIIHNLVDTNELDKTQETATTRTVKLIQRILNFALSLVSFIALIILIFAGVQMLTAAWDQSKFDAWKKTLRRVIIWIVWIAISRFIVSMIFRFIYHLWALKR
jgi:hypothetical protein